MKIMAGNMPSLLLFVYVCVTSCLPSDGQPTTSVHHASFDESFNFGSSRFIVDGKLLTSCEVRAKCSGSRELDAAKSGETDQSKSLLQMESLIRGLHGNLLDKLSGLQRTVDVLQRQQAEQVLRFGSLSEQLSALEEGQSNASAEVKLLTEELVREKERNFKANRSLEKIEQISENVESIVSSISQKQLEQSQRINYNRLALENVNEELRNSSKKLELLHVGMARNATMVAYFERQMDRDHALNASLASCTESLRQQKEKSHGIPDAVEDSQSEEQPKRTGTIAPTTEHFESSQKLSNVTNILVHTLDLIGQSVNENQRLLRDQLQQSDAVRFMLSKMQAAQHNESEQLESIQHETVRREVTMLRNITSAIRASTDSLAATLAQQVQASTGNVVEQLRGIATGVSVAQSNNEEWRQLIRERITPFMTSSDEKARQHERRADGHHQQLMTSFIELRNTVINSDGQLLREINASISSVLSNGVCGVGSNKSANHTTQVDLLIEKLANVNGRGMGCPLSTVSNGQMQIFWSYVNVSCHLGYEITTDQFWRLSYCRTDRTWSPPLSGCQIVRCPPLEDRYSLSTTNNQYGTSVNVECLPGFYFNHTSARQVQTHCQANKLWTLMPSCIRVNCPPLEGLITNATVNTTEVSFGTAVNVSCNSGLELNRGVMRRSWIVSRCKANRRWSLTPLDCTPEPSCLLPEDDYVSANVTTVQVGDMVNFACDDNYQFSQGVYSLASTCQYNLTWAPILPSCTDATTRLVGGASPAEGRVEVFHNGRWGTVCDDNFDSVDAGVVCVSIGFSRNGTAVGANRFGQGTGDILLDNLECRGNELTLVSCTHAGWGSHNCNHGEDVGVVCNTRT